MLPATWRTSATAQLFAGGLADNGGPTQTIALLDDPTNPALAGALAADAPDTDQRGEARPAPAGTNPDVGAFELSQSPPSDEIVGTKRADFLQGTSGGDVIRGLAGNDELWGLAGDDKLFGDNGKDSLFGKAGIDQSTGGLVPTGSCSARPARPHPTGRSTRRSWISTAPKATRSTCAASTPTRTSPAISRSNSSATPR